MLDTLCINDKHCSFNSCQRKKKSSNSEQRSTTSAHGKLRTAKITDFTKKLLNFYSFKRPSLRVSYDQSKKQPGHMTR